MVVLIESLGVIGGDPSVGIDGAENRDGLLEHAVHLRDLLAILAVLDGQTHARLHLGELRLHLAELRLDLVERDRLLLDLGLHLAEQARLVTLGGRPRRNEDRVTGAALGAAATRCCKTMGALAHTTATANGR